MRQPFDNGDYIHALDTFDTIPPQGGQGVELTGKDNFFLF
jgi:hypothetical protein